MPSYIGTSPARAGLERGINVVVECIYLWYDHHTFCYRNKSLAVTEAGLYIIFFFFFFLSLSLSAMCGGACILFDSFKVTYPELKSKSYAKPRT